MASAILDAYQVVQHFTVLNGWVESHNLEDSSASLRALIHHACNALQHLHLSAQPLKGLDAVFASLSEHCLALLSHGGNASSRQFSAHKHAAVSDVLWLCSYVQIHLGWRPAGLCKLWPIVLLRACYACHGMQYVAQEHLMVVISMLLRGDELVLEVRTSCVNVLVQADTSSSSQAFAHEHAMSTLCDTLNHAHPDLHPLLLQLLQIVAASTNADVFASQHHPHILRTLSHAFTRNAPHDQAIIICIKQCVAIKLSEMHADCARACLAQQQATVQAPPARVVAEEIDSESDETMFDIEL